MRGQAHQHITCITGFTCRQLAASLPLLLLLLLRCTACCDSIACGKKHADQGDMAASKATRIRRQTAQPLPAGLAGAEARARVIGGELVDGLRAAPPPPLVAAPGKGRASVGTLRALYMVEGKLTPSATHSNPINCKAKEEPHPAAGSVADA